MPMLESSKVEINVTITESVIDAELPHTHSDETGAVVEFWGTVRGSEEGRVIEGIEYEAYSAMAEKKMKELLGILSKDISVDGVTVIHRIGWVPVGEASLYIRVCSAHRKEAFQFCSDFIDELKKDVPIWKSSFKNPELGTEEVS